LKDNGLIGYLAFVEVHGGFVLTIVAAPSALPRQIYKKQLWACVWVQARK